MNKKLSTLKKKDEKKKKKQKPRLDDTTPYGGFRKKMLDGRLHVGK